MAVIQTDVHDGYLHYNALDLNISHRFSSGFPDACQLYLVSHPR